MSMYKNVLPKVDFIFAPTGKNGYWDYAVEKSEKLGFPPKLEKCCKEQNPCKIQLEKRDCTEVESKSFLPRRFERKIERVH